MDEEIPPQPPPRSRINGVIPDKQARRIEIPIAPIIELATRRGLVRPVLRECRADARQGKIILHLETDATPGQPQAAPFDFPIDWSEIFGADKKMEFPRE